MDTEGPMDIDRRRKPELRLRAEEVAQMREGGSTWREIGEHFGVDPSTAHGWLNGELPHRRDQVRKAVAKVQAARRAAGLCATCGGERAPRRKSCEACLRAGRERHKRPSAYPRQRARYRRQRAAAIAAYGGRCACCGESEPAFLTIDHVNRDGASHRREMGTSVRIEEWLAKHGYPEGFQVLCWNCNLGRERNDGVCPHETPGEVRHLRVV